MHSGHGGGGINENSARLRNPRKFVFHPWTAVAHFVPWLAQPEAIGKAGEISLGFSYLSDLPLSPSPTANKCFRLDDNDGRGILSSPTDSIRPIIEDRKKDIRRGEGYRESKGKIFISRSGSRRFAH